MTTGTRRVATLLAGVLVGVAALTAPPADAGDRDWPSRRGGQTNAGAVADSAITTATVSTLRASWAAVVEPSIWYEPVVVGEQAYVSCMVDDPRPYRHCAVGVADGTVRWRTPAREATAAVEGGTVFVAGSRHPATFQALDAGTGQVRWTTEPGGSQINMGPQPAGDLVLVTTDEPELNALDAATGAERWALEVSERGVTPAVVGDDVYVATGSLRVVDRRTGAARWTGRTPGPRLTGSPLVHGGLVIVGSRGDLTVAYDADGCGAEYCDPVWTAPYPTLYSPTAFGDLVVVVVERELVALDLASGALRWRTGPRTVEGGSPAAVAGDVAFATSSEGTLVAYAAGGCGEPVCAPLWSARIDEAGRPNSGPVVAGDAVYVTGTGALVRFSLPGDGPAVCPPGPPRNVRSRHESGLTVVEWDRPSDDGGAPVARWYVTAPDGSTSTPRGADTRTSFDGTKSGPFTVRGENARGMGPTQDEEPIPCDRGSGADGRAPRSVELHPGDGALLATWSPPLDGGEGIDAYTVTLTSEGGQTRTLRTAGERTWLEVTGLEDGVGYRATVTADGPASSPSEWVRPTAGAVLPHPAAGVARLRGPDRIATAIAISQERFADGQAGGAVIARADDFPDALTGTPLAAARSGPLLLSHSGRLPDAVLAELQRVLPSGGTVHLLGGAAALGAEVEEAIAAAGLRTVRVAGADRYQTAVAVARELGDPDLALLAVGTDFPDALAAGAAAARHGGAVLLTAADRAHPATVEYLAGHAGQRHAIGGPAARAHPEAQPVTGRTREETAVAVAVRYFPDAQVAGLARRDDFADALVGASHSADLGGPVLLTPSDGLHRAPAAHRCDAPIVQTWLYGGRAALDHGVTLDVARGC
jgi:outer membrane protein assembly factor BamB